MKLLSALAMASVISALPANPRSSPSAPFNGTVDQPTNASAPVTTPTNPNDLISSLILAPDAVDRIALLSDADFVFDFNTATTGIVQGNGGHTVKADRKGFPALIGTGASMTLGFLGPCGFNTPHVHNRATELNIVVQGRLQASSTLENGARHISQDLSLYQMTVFPQGATHTEWNPDCTPAVFVAAFPSEDPGVQQIAQTFFGFEDDVITAALGGDITVAGEDLDSFKGLIPANVALGVESCLAKCNIKKRSVAV